MFTKFHGWLAVSAATLLLYPSRAGAVDIGGTISSTLTITEDSQLVDDVTCAVTGTPCIAIGGPDVTIELNGFTITGQADPQTTCSSGPTTFVVGMVEDAIELNGQTNVAIHGPGLVQQFRGPGILSINSDSLTVTGVTVANNCMSGILVGGGTGHNIANNISLRNGSRAFACGGI